MITRQKLKIFDKYGGDIDGLERMGSSLEKELFRNDDWSLIDNSYQDIELINKKLTSKSYADQAIKNLKENCDSETFKILSNKILNLKDFETNEI